MRTLLLKTVLVVAILVGAWTLYHKDRIENLGDLIQLARQQISALSGADSRLAPWQINKREVIRIASFNFDEFGPNKLREPRILHMLAKIVRQYDVLAVQEISGADPHLVKQFINVVNSTNRQYRYVIAAQTTSESKPSFSAFFYDSHTIELENSQAYSINDPDDLLSREPFVGWFRTSRAPYDQAFTFSLVNLHLNRSSSETELNHLSQIFRAVRHDGRGEDDVIIAGDFQNSDQQLAALAYRQGLSWLITNQPTNTRGSHQYDNIVIDPLSTNEFTGESGVFDFMKQFNLTLAEALQVSDHMPVWAEFSITEEGIVEKVASLPTKNN